VHNLKNDEPHADSENTRGRLKPKSGDQAMYGGAILKQYKYYSFIAQNLVPSFFFSF
jgi:hypothetical protein